MLCFIIPLKQRTLQSDILKNGPLDPFLKMRQGAICTCPICSCIQYIISILRSNLNFEDEVIIIGVQLLIDRTFGVVDRPTQLIHVGISICQHTSTKDIAGKALNRYPKIDLIR